MNFNIFIANRESRARFQQNWPNLADLVVDNFDQLTHAHTVILRDDVTVIGDQFFTQIQELVAANNYLDALKHPVWMVFGNHMVKLNVDRDYWSLNFRPIIGFDDSTWKIND